MKSKPTQKLLCNCNTKIDKNLYFTSSYDLYLYFMEKKRKDSNSLDTIKRIKISKDVGVSSAFFSHRGRRQSMEDSHILLDSTCCKNLCPSSKIRLEMYGIMDGHGGRNVADFVQGHLPHLIFESIEKSAIEKKSIKQINSILLDSFRRLQELIDEAVKVNKWSDGCCCLLALIADNFVFIANLGDSRAILCRRYKTAPVEYQKAQIPTDNAPRRGQHTFPWDRQESCPPVPAEILTLTVDHRPTLQSEKQRIIQCGGQVEDGRVVGGGLALAVSRSFGDCALKRFHLFRIRLPL